MHNAVNETSVIEMAPANVVDHHQNGATAAGGHHRPSLKEVNRQGSASKLMVCAIGIFVCYFYYGIIQEKM